METFMKTFTNEWVAGACGHFSDTQPWYKSIDGARRGQADTAYYVHVLPSGQKYELWFSARAEAAYAKMCNDRMYDLKEAVALSEMLTGLKLNK